MLTYNHSHISENIKLWPWWMFSHKNPVFTYKVKVMCQILVSQHCLQSVTCHFTNPASSPACQMCDTNTPETADHMLFVCPKLSDIRKTLWDRVQLSVPPAMQAEMGSMSPYQKLSFLLSGLRCPYVKEWDEIYKNVANFIYDLYIQRKLYNPKINWDCFPCPYLDNVIYSCICLYLDSNYCVTMSWLICIYYNDVFQSC